MPSITPLEPWISRRMGLVQGERPTPERLAAYQLERLNAVLALAARQSPFYRRLWDNHQAAPRMADLADLARLPFTSADDLRRAPLQFLAVSRAEVARVVTLPTSGTTGEPKRISFSDADLADTRAFFRHGMATLVSPGQRVLILLPGNRPDSVGDLLLRSLADMEVVGIVHGPVTDPAIVVRAIRDERIDTLVGIPVHVLALARHPEGFRLSAGTLRNVLLTTDHVPPPLVREIRQAWDCAVFQHYGMTEMGYGGALSCRAHDGYHLRESDLLFEIVDPLTAQPVGPGRTGEVVFTTLTRRAMPLIRYRTGDLADWIEAPCPCGSVLRRMGWVRGRRQASVDLAKGLGLTMADLDNALFALPGVVDFRAALHQGGKNGRLHLTIIADPASLADLQRTALRALSEIPVIRKATATGALVEVPIDIEPGSGPINRVGKRTIAVVINQSVSKEPNP